MKDLLPASKSKRELLTFMFFNNFQNKITNINFCQFWIFHFQHNGHWRDLNFLFTIYKVLRWLQNTYPHFRSTLRCELIRSSDDSLTSKLLEFVVDEKMY